MNALAHPLQVARLMDGFERPWFIAGGWAIDMLLEKPARLHEDVDVAVLRADQGALRDYLAGWRWTKIVPGLQTGRRQAWPPGERLRLPVHELYAERNGYQLEFLLNESDGERWLFRRDQRVTLPLERLGRRAGESNTPVLAPEVVLLYKAQSPRPKDERDLESALPLMHAEQREWLKASLAVCYPGHPWLQRL